MPRYEYRCRKCNKDFEVVHAIGENHTKCVFCGGEVRRVFHPVGIVFKGSGFYATDSRAGSSSYKPPEPEEKVSKEPSPPGKEKEGAEKPKESAKAASD